VNDATYWKWARRVVRWTTPALSWLEVAVLALVAAGLHALRWAFFGRE
jgi:hypothetical protein